MRRTAVLAGAVALLLVSQVGAAAVPTGSTSDGSPAERAGASSPGLAGGDPITAAVGTGVEAGAVLMVVRHDRSDRLDHDGRRELYEAIERTPGSYIADLADRIGMSVSTLRYHSRVLIEADLVRSERILGKHRHYPATVDDEKLELFAALSDGPTGAILGAVDRIEPASVTELAEEVDRAPSTISYHLDRLVSADLVDRDRAGSSVLSSLTAGVREALSGDGRDARSGAESLTED